MRRPQTPHPIPKKGDARSSGRRDDRRCGTIDLFAAPDVQAGTVIGRCPCRHRSIEFRWFLDAIEACMPAEADVQVVLDHAAIHKTKLVQDWLAKREHFHLHFTPTSGSWLDLVECWFALLTRRRLQRGIFTSTQELAQAVHTSIAANHADPRPFVWTKSADTILASIARFRQRTSNSDH